MHAIETERSPGLPSLIVTTRRRLLHHGTSCSFLQAVTQALHSMHLSASHRNFMRAMAPTPSRHPDLAQRALGLLHAGHRIEPICGERVRALSEYDWVGARRVFVAHVA